MQAHAGSDGADAATLLSLADIAFNVHFPKFNGGDAHWKLDEKGYTGEKMRFGEFCGFKELTATENAMETARGTAG